MRLFEFEAKNILKECGIPVPRGKVAYDADEAEAIAREIDKAVVLKSQIMVASRGKAGGIVFADDIAGVKKSASNLIGSTIKESLITSLLVEEKLDISEQFYTSIAIDRQARAYIVMASTEGGVDIEETAQASPDKIARYWVDPETGVSQAVALSILGRFSMDKDDAAKVADIISILYRLTMDNDAELVELNPLVKTAAGEFIAADAKIIVDDNALFRHPDFKSRSPAGAEATPREAEAKKQNLAYVDLTGNIGIVGNGAGLVMATVDLVHHFGGRPANFLDIGGGSDVDITKRGLLLVIAKPEVKAILVNILGGITRCDVVARAIIAALNESSAKKPVIVRMIGTNEVEGTQILHRAGIKTHSDMEEAVKEITELIG